MSDFELNKAVGILLSGGVVVFPTDTVWGMGCRADNLESIERLFSIRRRPPTQAAPILVSSIDQAREYFLPTNAITEKLMNRYWPGGLTIVYHAREEKIPSLARGNQKTIGLRMPNSQKLIKIISDLGVPILGPSANFHNAPTPTNFNHLDPQLLKLVDYMIPGECGGNQASTVVDATGSPVRIIRQGAVDLTEIINEK